MDYILFLNRILDDIERVVWSSLTISDTPEAAGFVYSLGLWKTYQHPEILISGLNEAIGYGFLCQIAMRIKNEGFVAQVDQEDWSIAAECPSIFKRIHRDRYGDWLFMGVRLYGHYDFPVMQLVYPDRNHRFPWQEGYSIRAIA